MHCVKAARNVSNCWLHHQQFKTLNLSCGSLSNTNWIWDVLHVFFLQWLRLDFGCSCSCRNNGIKLALQGNTFPWCWQIAAAFSPCQLSTFPSMLYWGRSQQLTQSFAGCLWGIGRCVYGWPKPQCAAGLPHFLFGKVQVVSHHVLASVLNKTIHWLCLTSDNLFNLSAPVPISCPFVTFHVTHWNWKWIWVWELHITGPCVTEML